MVSGHQEQLSSKRKTFLSTALDFKIEVPCVVQWSLLWFSASTKLNRILGRYLKIKKDHEVVNNAIMDDTEVVYVDFGGQSPASYTQEVES